MEVGSVHFWAGDGGGKGLVQERVGVRGDLRCRIQTPGPRPDMLPTWASYMGFQDFLADPRLIGVAWALIGKVENITPQ